MRTCCAGFLKWHNPQLAMDLCPARVCQQSAGAAGHGRPMARGRNGAPKKSGTSSSVSEGRVWEVPSQKEKRDLIVVIFCRDMTLWGSYPHAPALNATGRLSSLQQKTFAPALWGIPVPGINPRPGVPRFASIHAGPRVFFVCVSAYPFRA